MVFKEEVLTFRALSQDINQILSAVAYRTPGPTSTEELFIGYDVVENTISIKLSLMVSNDDQIRHSASFFRIFDVEFVKNSQVHL